jgi:CHAD domain-containing protein
MKNDVSMHRLRIDLKKLSAALRVLLSHDYEVASRLDQVKTIQSELGQIRDLRRFYILPGLDAQTRYRAVTQLTTLEERFKERFDPKSN